MLNALGVLAAAAKTSGSSITSLLPLVAIAAGFYFLILRPQSQRAKKQREQGKTFDVGDEVLTAGGLVGHVLDIDEDRITLETSVGASFVVLRPYILRQIVPEPVEDDAEGEDEDDDHDGHDHDHDDHEDDDHDHDDHDDHDHDDGPGTNG